MISGSRTFAVLVVIVFGFVTPEAVRAQASNDEYTRQVNLAHGYMQERRFQDALDALRGAYDLDPNPGALSEVGKSFLALGMGTEADEVFMQALVQGAAIPFEFHHEHGMGGCKGTLHVSAGQVRWVSTNQKENFEARIDEIEKMDWFTTSDFEGSPGTAVYVKLRIHKKNYSLNYLLHGFGNYQYAGAPSVMVVYNGLDLQNAVKAHTLILELIRKASSMHQAPPIGRTLLSDQSSPSTDQAAPVRTGSSVSSPMLQAQDPSWAPKDEPVEVDKQLRKLNIGDRNVSQGEYFLLGKEIETGKQLAQEVERSSKLIDDPVVTEYVNRVGQNLVRNSDAHLPFTIKIVDSKIVGIWPLPGGFLYVSAGLVLTTGGEAELATALAHGIAHTTARHYDTKKSKSSLAEYLKVELPIGDEAEADFLGLQYMYRAGYDTNSAVMLSEKLQAEWKRQTLPIARSSSNHLISGRGRLLSLYNENVGHLVPRSEYIVSTSEFLLVQARLGKNRAEHDRETVQVLNLGDPQERVESFLQGKEWVWYRTKTGYVYVGKDAGQGFTIVLTDGRVSIAPTIQSAKANPSRNEAVELKENQTPEEVKKLLGEPEDTITVKDTLIYIYPTVKVFFENGKLINVEERKR